MEKEANKGYRRFLLGLNSFVIFFIIVAFVVTASTMLFVTVLTETLEITLSKSELDLAARLTFLNVVILSVLLTAIDCIRRRFTVDRPVKKITQSIERIIAGDFSARIESEHIALANEKFGAIIDGFNKMAEELSGVETLRGDFIANVSHELKTPAAVIQNYASLLTNPALSEDKRREYSGAIIVASKRLSELITNILKLSKLENQRLVPSPTRYNLSEQLCECLLNFEEMWERKNIDIKTDIAEDVYISTDGEMLSLVFNNLISNALKFTAEGGEVGVSLRTEGELAVVSVSDTGIGISPEVGAHIFDKFYQGDTSRATEGNGLGLALVRRVVDILGCDISVKSEVGKGSVFTLSVRRDKSGEI